MQNIIPPDPPPPPANRLRRRDPRVTLCIVAGAIILGVLAYIGALVP